MSKIHCASADCNSKFEPKNPSARYCSKQCRWREHKRKTYKKRIKGGLCPQCGGELILTVSAHKDKVTPSYCKKCQEYFQKRYKTKKPSNQVWEHKGEI